MVRLFLLTFLIRLGTLGFLAILFLSCLYATHISILTSDRLLASLPILTESAFLLYRTLYYLPIPISGSWLLPLRSSS